MKLRKVLVTGAAGFIGSHVIERLQDEGIKVLVFDHSVPGFLHDIPKGHTVEVFHGDIRDEVAVTEAAAHVDGIIHLAAVLGTQETIQNPRPSAQTNILGALNVFEAAVQYDLPVVYAGVGNHWMREHGAGSYTISKTAVEDYAKMYNHFRGGKISVVRPVNAYGPRQSVAAPYGSSKVRKIMPSFICRALLGDDIEVYGGGLQISDCVHVSDVARTFVAALRYTAENGAAPHAIEIGPDEGESYDVRSIAELVKDEAYRWTGQRSEIVSLPMRPGEVPDAVVSSKKGTRAILGEEFNSVPLIPLEEGVKETVKWFHDTWLADYRKNGN